MAEMIPVVEATGAQAWSNAVTIAGHTDSLQFRVVGGTFDDDSTDKTIAPTSGSDYTVALKATVTVGESETQPVLLYYQDGGTWLLVHSLSRIFKRPQVKALDYRLLVHGMDALPLGATLNPIYNGLVLGGGVRIPTAQAMQQSTVAKFSDFDSTFFDLTKPVSIVYDRQARVLYYIHTDGAVGNTKVFGGMYGVDIAGYKVSYDSTGKRSAVVFHTSGQVDVLDEAMTQYGEPKQLGYKVNRVVCRRAGVGTNTVDSYVAFDDDGRAHYLNASFVETSVKSDQFYVNGSDSYDVLSTFDGKLVGANTSNSSDVFWYQFVPSSLFVLGYNPTTMRMCQFDLMNNRMNVAPRDLIANDRVVYNTTAAWTADGGKLVAGFDTNGSDALFGFADGEDPSQTRSGWPYVEMLTPPYKQEDTYDRLFYYAARPASNVKHLAIRNFDVVMPDLSNVELGTTVTFKVVVDAADPDMPLTIVAPAGVTVAATIEVTTSDIVDGTLVETTETVPVTKVYDGQEVTITLTHPFITSSSFPISIGRSVYLFEMKADDTPNPYAWQNILGIENDTWNRTEDVAITGINVSVPVSVLVDGVEDYDRVKIFVDGVETAMPVYLRNNQTLGFEILHENNTSRIDVNVGQGTSHFGLYTIVEAHLDVGRHWAYMPAGKEVQSDSMKNTGTIPLTLTITDTDAVFANGSQTITLPVNASTNIKFTPAENKQYTVKFHSDQYSYEWHVWADAEWVGTPAPTKRAERYVLGDSGDLFVDNIPDNFWTYITVPAGMLLDVDGVRVAQTLDSRGVYKEQGLVIGPFECADTMLKIYGLPSHQQPHTLVFGDAELGWLYDLTVDPTYVPYWYDTILTTDLSYKNGVTDAVTDVDLSYAAASAQNVILTPAYDPDLDVQLEWLDFEDATTHNVASVVREFDTAKQLPQYVPAPEFDTGHKDFVDNFKTFTLIDGADAKADKFDLFQHVQGTDIAGDKFDLFEHVQGTNIASDKFDLFKLIEGSNIKLDSIDLFELVQGNKDVVQDMSLPTFIGTDRSNTLDSFPLFESLIGNTIAADSFWPDFDVGSTIKDDTFANNFLEQLLNEPESFELASPAYRTTTRAIADQIRPRFVEIKNIYPTAAIEGHKVDAGGIFPQQMSEGQYVQSSANFPQPMFSGSWLPANATYHIDWARPLWRPAYVTYKTKAMVGRYVDPIYHPAVLFMKEIPFVRWMQPPVRYHYDPANPLRMEHIVKYPVAPAANEFYQLKQIAGHVVPHIGRFSATSPTYHHEMIGDFVESTPTTKTDILQPDLIKAPRVIKARTSSAVPTTRPAIRVEIQKSRKTTRTAYAIPTPVFEEWSAPPNHGDMNEPLKEGYFETELEALQNATQVWGFDASVVYAIKQVNGYWTWAQITVCEESCGSMSCAARGYLSGG